jgi:DNA excision repair protein ERCC-4
VADEQVYKNCNPGLALRVYQMMYANSFEEDRFLSTMQREDDAFKKLIDDRSVSDLSRCDAELTVRAWSFRSTTTIRARRCATMYRGQRRRTRRGTLAAASRLKSRESV